MTSQQLIMQSIQGADDLVQLKAALSVAMTTLASIPSTTSNDIELLTVKQACVLLGGISKQTFYELTRQPDFVKPYRLNKRVVRYGRVDLFSWLETCRERT